MAPAVFLGEEGMNVKQQHIQKKMERPVMIKELLIMRVHCTIIFNISWKVQIQLKNLVIP